MSYNKNKNIDELQQKHKHGWVTTKTLMSYNNNNTNIDELQQHHKYGGVTSTTQT